MDSNKLTLFLERGDVTVGSLQDAIDRGANLQAVDGEYGWTPLHQAVGLRERPEITRGC